MKMKLECPSKDCKYNTEKDGCQFDGIIFLIPAESSDRCDSYKQKRRT